MKIYTTRIKESVCMYVCTAICFIMLWGIKLKVGMGVEDWPTRFVGIFSKRPHLGTKVIQGSICLSKCPTCTCMATKFGEKKPWPEHSAFAGVICHAGVTWGQPGVKLLRNALWSPNLVGRIPDQSVKHCWGQRSYRGQLGSSRGQFA